MEHENGCHHDCGESEIGQHLAFDHREVAQRARSIVEYGVGERRDPDATGPGEDICQKNEGRDRSHSKYDDI